MYMSSLLMSEFVLICLYFYIAFLLSISAWCFTSSYIHADEWLGR